LEEAVRQGQDALESWIDVARKQGEPIPHLRYFGLAAVGAVEEAPPARTR
jgi:predicted RNase H-like HicB family nuclease